MDFKTFAIIMIIGTALTAICSFAVTAGIVIFALAVIVGLFYFFSTPIYAVLNTIKKAFGALFERIHSKSTEQIFAQYKEDESKITM